MGDGVGCGSSSSTRTVAALKVRASRRQSRRGRCSGVGEVGTRGWAARRGVGGSARSRRGAGVSRVRERERARPGPWLGGLQRRNGEAQLNLYAVKGGSHRRKISAGVLCSMRRVDGWQQLNGLNS